MAKTSDKTPSPASPPPLRVLPMQLQLDDLLKFAAMMAAHIREENRHLVNDFSRRRPARCGSQASRPMIPAVERPGR